MDSTTTPDFGTVRYMPPELLNPTQFHPTKESDVYSLAMTAYEVGSPCICMAIAHLVSFHQILTDGLPYGNARDRVWDMVVKCWSEQREERRDARTVYNQLSASSIQETAQSERGG